MQELFVVHNPPWRIQSRDKTQQKQKNNTSLEWKIKKLGKYDWILHKIKWISLSLVPVILNLTAQMQVWTGVLIHEEM